MTKKDKFVQIMNQNQVYETDAIYEVRSNIRIWGHAGLFRLSAKIQLQNALKRFKYM